METYWFIGDHPSKGCKFSELLIVAINYRESNQKNCSKIYGMADLHSFDIVSKVNDQEIDNAINQTRKEVAQRYDLKDANCSIDFNQKDHLIKISAVDEYKLKAVLEILKQRAIKREISPKALVAKEVESAMGGTAKQEIEIQQGISKERAKEVTKAIKDSGLKVQTQIQDDQIRVTSKSIDDLQAVMKLLREKNFDFHIQFINFR